MLFQRKIDGAMKKLHEGSDAAEEERRKEAGEPYEEMERPELEKGDIPAMIIAAFLWQDISCYTDWQETTGADKDYCVKTRREFEGGRENCYLGIVSRKRNKRNSAAGKRNGRGN